MTATRVTRDDLVGLLVVVSGAFVLRLLWMRVEPVITPDGFFYATLGHNLISADPAAGLSVYWPPMYPLVIGFVHLAVPSLEHAARLASVGAGTVVVALVFVLALHVWDRTVARVAAALVAVYPVLLHGSIRVLADMTYTCLFVAGVLFGMLALFEDRRGAYFWAGICFGGAYLTRPEGFAYVGLLLVLGPVVTWLRGTFRPREALRGAVLLIVGFSALAAPYVFYNKQETGAWTISTKFRVHLLSTHSNWFRILEPQDLTFADMLWAGRRPAEAAPAMPTDPHADREAREPSRAVVIFLKKLSTEYRGIVPELFPPLILLLVGAGLLNRAGGAEQTLRELYLAVVFVATAFGYALTQVDERYLMSQVPLVLCWAAAGIVGISRRMLPSSDEISARVRWTEAAVVPALVLLTLVALAQDYTYPMRSKVARNGTALREAGDWLGHHDPTKPTVMTGSPEVAFYAGLGRFYYTPHEPLDVTLAYARRKGVDYLEVDSWRDSWRSHLRPLLDVEDVPGDLELVYRDDGVDGPRVRIYRLLEPAPPAEPS